MVHDERDETQVMSYLAERGRIISNDEGSYLIMSDGYVHRFNAGDEEKAVQIVAFDKNMLDISQFSPKDKKGKEFRPKERSTDELIFPDPDDKLAQTNRGLLRAELHGRLATPLYPLVFVFIAIAVMGQARTTRQSRWGQILTVFLHRDRPESGGTCGRESGGSPCVGGGPGVWYSGGGDSNCGMDGAR